MRSPQPSPGQRSCHALGYYRPNGILPVGLEEGSARATRAYYFARAKKASADPLPFALETMLWQSSLSVSQDVPEALVEACKIYGVDLTNIKAAAKAKPEKSPEVAPASQK